MFLKHTHTVAVSIVFPNGEQTDDQKERKICRHIQNKSHTNINRKCKHIIFSQRFRMIKVNAVENATYIQCMSIFRKCRMISIVLCFSLNCLWFVEARSTLLNMFTKYLWANQYFVWISSKSHVLSKWIYCRGCRLNEWLNGWIGAELRMFFINQDVNLDFAYRSKSIIISSSNTSLIRTSRCVYLKCCKFCDGHW